MTYPNLWLKIFYESSGFEILGAPHCGCKGNCREKVTEDCDNGVEKVAMEKGYLCEHGGFRGKWKRKYEKGFVFSCVLCFGFRGFAEGNLVRTRLPPN